jgi:hypothetical protein
MHPRRSTSAWQEAFAARCGGDHVFAVVLADRGRRQANLELGHGGAIQAVKVFEFGPGQTV